MTEEKDNFEIQQQKIEELLKEFSTHRDEIKKMINDLEQIRKNVDKLIPEILDSRYIRYFEEKVKSITHLFNALLEMRKEIAKSAKDEIDIRRRLKDKSSSLDLEEILDVRDMVDKIDIFKEKTNKLKKDRIEKSQSKEVDESIVIPGINDEGE